MTPPEFTLPRRLLVLLAGAFLLLAAGCDRTGSTKSAAPTNSPVPARGEPIRSLSTNATGLPNAPATNQLSAAEMAALLTRKDIVVDGLVQPGFDKLSAFKFDVYEVYSETNAGRAQLRSDDTIPPVIKTYDGRRVIVKGYVLPLRTKRGVVTEFLLMRDQGTCCFGARAQINHFIRVSFSGGIKPGDAVPWIVSGTLHVGETYVQGYLTGIYRLDAEEAAEAPRP